MELLTVYKEPEILNTLTIITNSLFIYLVFFIPAYLAKRTIKLPSFINKNIIWVNAYALINVLLAVYIPEIIIPEIIVIYSGLMYLSLKLKRKSIKWTNFSYLLFMLFIIFSYYLFLFLVNNFTTNLLEIFGIKNYLYSNKPFFEISLGSFYQEINVGNYTISNNILYRKLYLFYYTMITFALSFWLFLFKKSLEKHSLKEPVEMIYKKEIKAVESIKDNLNIEKETANIKTIQEGHNIMKMTEILESKYNKDYNEALNLREQIVSIKELEFELKLIKNELENHPIFNSIKTIKDLQVFMETHVYCVWDFMSLLKRLQNDICCTSVPWVPKKNGNMARLINDIVIEEETDVLPNGSYASHFEIYLLAMKEIGANTQQIESFINIVNKNSNYLDQIPEPAKDFVKATLNTAINSPTHCVMGSFCNGRETVIPAMFKRLLKDWNLSEEQAPMFHYYLIRHIELDGDDHGPASEKMMIDMTKDNPNDYIELLKASISSIKDRINLWTSLKAKIDNK